MLLISEPICSKRQNILLRFENFGGGNFDKIASMAALLQGI